MALTKDMTVGNETSLIVKFSLPLLFGNLFQQLYNLVDSLIVGRYIGYEALASVGATGSLTFLFYSLCNGLSTGTGIMTAQYFGANDDRNLKKSIINSAYIVSLFGIVISLLGIVLAEQALRLLDTPESIISDSIAYMRISCGGTLAIAAYNWIAAVMRSLGDSKTPLIFLIVASVINVVLDLLFVIKFGMGVSGAAWATIISQGVSAAVSIVYAFIRNPYFRFEREHFKPEGYILKRCIKMGMPIAAQSAMIAVSMVVLQRVANGFGETVVAAYTATMRIEQLVQQPFSTLNMALSTFTGQNTGAGKAKRIVTGYHKCIIIVLAFALLMLGIFFIWAKNIVGLFVDEPKVIEIGANALKLTAIFYFPLGMIHITRGLLNGAGDTIYSMINGAAEVIGRIGFSTILVHIPIVGCWAVWGTSALTWTLTAAASVIRYKQGKWRAAVAHSTEEQAAVKANE